MSNKNLFELAVKNKYRFPYKGQISIEDLYDLGVEQLDSVFKVLNKELKITEEDSLLNTKTKQNQELQDKIEIIKLIVEEKQAEKLARLNEAEKANQKQKILNLLAKKQEEELSNLSAEELQKMLEEI